LAQSASEYFCGQAMTELLNPDSPSSPSKRKTTFVDQDAEQSLAQKDETAEDEDKNAPEEADQSDQPPLRSRSNTIQSFLKTSGYYTCISKEPLPLRWNLEEDSPSGTCFEAGNVVRMRSFVYVDPYLWAEVLSGGFVCAGKGDSRREAAGILLEEYFVPFALPDDEPVAATETGEALEHALRKLERKASRKLTVEGAQAGSLADAEAAAGAADSDNSGGSSDEEDIGARMAERILELFHSFDMDRDGTIELDDLKRVMQAIDKRKWTDQKVTQLMSQMDTDKDRCISYEEFIDWVCGTCRWRKERRIFFRALRFNTEDVEEMREAVAKRGATIAQSIACWQ